MRFSKLATFAVMSSALVFASRANATPLTQSGTFTTGGYYSGNQNNFTTGFINFSVNGMNYSDAAGNIAGSTGVIAGNNVAFADTYCVDLWHDIYLNTTYTATYNTSGVIEGSAVNNAGEIAWMILNLAPNSSNTAANEGLQAAIWSVEYSGFVLGSNSADVTNAYNADLAALGNKTASLSSVQWMTATNGNGSFAQGQVVYTGGTPITHTNNTPPSVTPEPGSLILLGTGILGIAGAVRRKLR